MIFSKLRAFTIIINENNLIAQKIGSTDTELISEVFGSSNALHMSMWQKFSMCVLQSYIRQRPSLLWWTKQTMHSYKTKK